MSKQYDPYTDPGFGYSCLCGDYDHGTVPERIICAACKVEEQKQQLATLTQERDALVKELAVTKGALAIFEQNSAACAEEFEGRLKAEKERDALRDSLWNLVRDGNWLLTHLGDDGMAGETAALDFGMSLEESEALLIPGGEAGKCSQCGNDSSVYGCFLKDAKRSICRSTACKHTTRA